MPTVLIVSKDGDFSQPLAEHIRQELSCAAEIVESAEKSRLFATDVQAVVATEPLSGKWLVPVIPVLQGRDTPVKLGTLLTDIRKALAPKEEALRLGKRHHFSMPGKSVIELASGKTASLTDKETQLLALLARQKNKTVTREILLKKIWDQAAELESHALETHIYRLRAKLSDVGLPDAIAAAAGGYALKVK